MPPRRGRARAPGGRGGRGGRGNQAIAAEDAAPVEPQALTLENVKQLLAEQSREVSKQIRAEVRSVAAGSERSKKKRKKNRKKKSSASSDSSSTSSSTSSSDSAESRRSRKKVRRGSEPTRKEILRMKPEELLELDVDHVLPVSDAWLPWTSAPGDPEEQAARGRLLAREIQESHLREGTARYMGGAYYERDFLTKMIRLALSPEPAEKRLKYMTGVVAARCEYVKAARLGGTKAASEFWTKAMSRRKEDPILRKVLEKSDKRSEKGKGRAGDRDDAARSKKWIPRAEYLKKKASSEPAKK